MSEHDSNRRNALGAALGRTLIIANPVAQSGAGKRIAGQLQRFLALYHHDNASFELVYTEHMGHAVELAEAARDYDSVLALGGDGVVHEVANGIMRIDAEHRPALGVVPVGSGNDFARTLGLDDYGGKDFARLLTCERVSLDVGRITYVPATGIEGAEPQGCGRAGQHRTPNPAESSPAPMPPDILPAGEITGTTNDTATEYFVQTLSFGLDAAVAIGTVDLRATVALTGAPLYLMSGAGVFLRSFRSYPARVSIDGGAAQELRTFLMAIQLGPTYGSGFLICPEADPADGCFDLCYASGKATRAHALALLLRAKNGHHLSSPLIHTATARHLELSFERDDYPIQADGERLRARSMTVDLLPGELTVLRPL